MTMNNIYSILIANRGEIAVRIIRTAKKMGIRTIAVYPEQDKDALHVKLADQAWNLGTGSLKETYLNNDKLIQIAQNANADAIHPGYGFLSENSNFAASCETADITFIGPPASAIQTMGNKLKAAEFVDSLGVPVLNVQTGSPDKLLESISEEDMPVMIKAASGGGGKGMRLVKEYSELKDMLKTTAREAKSYFGDGTVYIEKFLESPKHIEVQVLCDKYGNCIHLFERECSIQRRHQKIIEEAPSPALSEKQRTNMTNDAIKIAQAIGYVGAGTVEFLLDNKGNHFFLEMNTRIQVEHPVTEMITGIDIVEEQIDIAQNIQINHKQENLNIHGHAIEARIYAENPANNFLPSPGNISYFQTPKFHNIRIDSGIESYASISADYDPLIAKITGWGSNRAKAINQLQKALHASSVTGIHHNLPYLYKILEQHSFVNNQFSTDFIEQHHDKIIEELQAQYKQVDKTMLFAAYIFINSINSANKNPHTVWEDIGYWRTFMKWNIYFNEEPHEVFFRRNNYEITIITEETEETFALVENQKHHIRIRTQNRQGNFVYSTTDKATEIIFNGLNYILKRADHQNTIANKKQHTKDINNEKNIKSPMFGKVLAINVGKNTPVKKGQTLLVLEAMKMENNIIAPFDTEIKEIKVKEGDQVEDGQILLQISYTQIERFSLTKD